MLLERKTNVINGKIVFNVRPHVVQLYKNQANQEDLGPALRSLRAPAIVILASPEQTDMSVAGRASFAKSFGYSGGATANGLAFDPSIPRG